jgi:hypothetical protein
MITEFDNIFVMFAPGTGGNHLANLMSLDSRYAKRFDPSDYDFTTNNNSDAHYATLHGGPENLNLYHPWIDINCIKLQKNILCGHVLEYLQLKNTTNILEQLPNKAFVTIQVPTPGDRAHTRMTWRYGKMDNYMLGELAVLYDAPNLKKIFDLPEIDVWHYVWPKDLFDDDISPVLNQIQHVFGLDLDQTLAQELHTKWLANLERNKQL